MFELAALAYMMDLCWGEFPWKHPVAFMGDFISGFEQKFYRNNILSGAILVGLLLTISLLFSLGVVYVTSYLPDGLALCILALLASMGLAMHMLHSSVASILTAEQPKQALSYLVSRDTAQMTESDIIKAALETWAENLSDGVVAPLFYLVLFGLPGIVVYKAINTLDSMIAYKTPRYFYFGKTAAILDDLANFVPARLTALLIMLLAHDKRRCWQIVRRDGAKLESPNAGVPIAALAGLLGVQLAGDAYYHGQLKSKPALGLALNPVNRDTLKYALALKNGFNAIILMVLLTGMLLT